MPYDFDKITTLQIDCTSYCNSFCGECARNIQGGEKHPHLKLQHMTLDMWENITANNSLEYIDKIIFNGNFGDICMHPNILEILEYVNRTKKDISIQIHTNGSNRTLEFWKDLAIVLKKFSGHEVIFGIDGLEDTSSRYRRGTNFNTTIENAKAMIAEDAFVTWRFIVFDHNKHQIEEASKYAKSLGFTRFVLNRSYNTDFKVKEYKSFPADHITAPSRNEVKDLLEKYRFNNKQEEYKQITKNNPISSSCPWESDRQIQIDFLGRVLPCCYFSMLPIKRDVDTGKVYGSYKWLEDKYNEYDDFNDLSKHSLKDILSHKFFKEDLITAWNNNEFDVCNKCQGKTTIK